MRKKLAILENLPNGDVVEPNVRLMIDIHLDKLTLIIQKKLKTMEIRDEYFEEFTIDEETPIDDLINQFYLKYLKLSDIEDYWDNALKNTEVIEFDLTEEDTED